MLCTAGACTECEGNVKQCSVCAEGDANCSTNRPQKCVSGHWQNEAEKCAHYCNAGECAMPPSCPAAAGLRSICQGESCCTSLRVEGGNFSRDYDGTDLFYAKDQYPATVTSFLLDKFEVTVGRMREFVATYGQLQLADGAGKSNHIADDTGWKTTLSLPLDKDALISMLKCDKDTQTWSDTSSLNNDLPINCVSFNVAYAFCIWDGGRLPTEAEWNFAATGGDEQRPFPWKTPASGPAISVEHANYSATTAIAVGSKALGNGRWGQADLAGNVGEWTLDFYHDYPESCVDCVNLSPAGERTERGGYFVLPEDYLYASLRGYSTPDDALPTIGFRCARDLE